MLLGLTTPTSGSIKYFGKDFDKHREYILSRINFASAYAHLQGKMTVRQNLRIYGMLYNVSGLEKKIEELSEILEIRQLLEQTFWTLSSGQQTRAILAKSLLNDPKLLLMDEPTASLDPDIVNKIIDLIRRLQSEKNVAILYTSHNMEEITRVCDRVIFLYKGKVLAEDTPFGLTKLAGNATLSVTFIEKREKVTDYLKAKGFKYEFPRKHTIEIDIEEKDIPPTLFEINKIGVTITDIDIKKPTLEDVFLAYARKGAR